jgi:hypothetical protein
LEFGTLRSSGKKVRKWVPDCLGELGAGPDIKHIILLTASELTCTILTDSIVSSDQAGQYDSEPEKAGGGKRILSVYGDIEALHKDGKQRLHATELTCFFWLGIGMSAFFCLSSLIC